MIGEYNGYDYFAIVSGEQISLITYNVNKKTEGFENKRDYYKKSISIDDPDLERIYDIHFFVRYNDCAESKDYWCVDEGRAIGANPDIELGRVVIDIDHDSKDSTWIQYDKGAAYKIIGLDECKEYFIEKRYIKKNGVRSKEIETMSVSKETFKKSMIMNRRKEL